MNELIEEWSRVLETAADRFLTFDDETVSTRPGPGRWSKKEILGHLIDSASNNHQRFVRAQMNRHLVTPGYEQDDWVALQGYNEQPWTDVVNLWYAYNRHLVYVVSRMNPVVLDHVCTIGSGTPVSLRDVIVDYLHHLKHHLQQIGIE